MAEKRPLSDRELDEFFAAAQRTAPSPSDDLMARILSDAEAATGAEAHWGAAPVARAPRPWLAQALAGLGGWPGLAGLTTAAVAGLGIGIASPETLEAVSGGYFYAALGYEMGDLMPALGAFIEEG